MKKKQHPSATHLGGTFWIAESRAELVRAMPKQKNEDEVSEWQKKQKEQSLRAGNKKKVASSEESATSQDDCLRLEDANQYCRQDG
ncbi:MAG: hypothetical protein SPK09_07495 [Porphyromonas sp.]|nr:hypothetical protein [Porphyromonas sp.]